MSFGSFTGLSFGRVLEELDFDSERVIRFSCPTSFNTSGVVNSHLWLFFFAVGKVFKSIEAIYSSFPFLYDVDGIRYIRDESVDFDIYLVFKF